MSSAVARHKATLDDAYAIRGVGAIQANPAGNLVAMEAEGGILVVSLVDGNRRIRQLGGGTSPAWSPDGARLAFFSTTSNQRQLFVWNRATGVIDQATDIPGGVTPNVYASGSFCSPLATSWSPDSRKITFGSRLFGTSGKSLKTSEVQDRVRVFDSKSPIDHTLIEGVFKRASFWDAFAPDNPDLGEKMKRADLDPELVRNRLFVVDVEAKSWTVLRGTANQHYCPNWSPDGRKIAAVADTSSEYPSTYFGSPGMHVQNSKLSIFDVSSGQERLVDTATNRVGRPMWSPDGQKIALVVEAKPPILSFTRIVVYSLRSNSSTFVPAPNHAAASEVRWTRDGKALVVRIADRFTEVLWLLEMRNGRQRRIDTSDRQVNSFDELPDRQFVLNTESGQFTGRVIVTTGAADIFQTVYDANPQLVDVELGEQRRVTWTSKAGAQVDGIVILPPGFTTSRRYPLIVNPYPMLGRDIFWLRPQYESTGQLEAARGYVVFRPNLRVPNAVVRYPRGEDYSESARGAAGIALMVDDFVSGIEKLESDGIADPDRIGMFGHSNGGWATNMLITETSIVKAAVVSSGISNAILMSFFPLPMVTRGKDPATNGNVFDQFDDYVKLSPIFRMRNVKIPVLLTVGDQDWLWLPQMLAQYGVLRSEGRDVQLVRYADEEHSLSSRSSIEDARKRAAAFFDSRLAGLSTSQ